MALKLGNIILIKERNWEVILEHSERVADKNKIVMVRVNPNNPWSVVFSHEHLTKVTGMENKLGLLIVSDELYALKIYPVFGTFLQ